MAPSPAAIKDQDDGSLVTPIAPQATFDDLDDIFIQLLLIYCSIGFIQSMRALHLCMTRTSSKVEPVLKCSEKAMVRGQSDGCQSNQGLKSASSSTLSIPPSERKRVRFQKDPSIS